MTNAKKIIIVIIAISLTLILQACGNAEPKADDSGDRIDESISNTINDYTNPNNPNNPNNKNTNNTTKLYYGLGENEPADDNDVSQSMEHSDINNDPWFSGLSYEEKLCKKYLGQPQTQGLPLPNTYGEAVTYLRKALFFFPDNPSYMTDEQKLLFQSSCFWNGMKIRFVFNGKVVDSDGTHPQVEFDLNKIIKVTKTLDSNRYYLFTRRFFDKMFNQTLKRRYCESHDILNPYNDGVRNLWTFSANFVDHNSNCGDGEIAFYSYGENNSFTSQRNNTRLSNLEVNSKFISDMEVLLAIRNLRAGSYDGIDNLSYLSDLDDGTLAFSFLGFRGTTNQKWSDGSYNARTSEYKFEPLKIIEAIQNFGEIAIDITRPKDKLFDINNDSANIDADKINYQTDYTMHPNENNDTKNITKQVQYWGWQPEHTLYIHNITVGDLMHETMHSLGYAHGNLYDRTAFSQGDVLCSFFNSYYGYDYFETVRYCDKTYKVYPDNGIDVAYYVGDLIASERYDNAYDRYTDYQGDNFSINRYYMAVVNGTIPAYYSDVKKLQQIKVFPTGYDDPNGDTVIPKN